MTTAKKAVVPAVPTQVANPSRASWRTYVQSVVSFLVGANIVLPIVSEFLSANVAGLEHALGPIYGWLVIGVNFAILVFGLGAKLIALFMAKPAVNDWITKNLPWLAPVKPPVG